MPLRVRTARRADLPALVRLCRAAVGPHDYVLSYLAEMVAGREVRVVEDRRRIVAMAGITECADGALWLGQLRTAPRFRRRGYATRLLDDAFGRVVRERRPALRLWTSRRNAAAQAAFERNGFRRVAVFTRLAAPPIPGRAVHPRSVSPRQAWNRWRRSLANRDGGGYVDYRWHFLPLTRQILTTMGLRRELFGLGGTVCLVWTENGESALYGSVIAGGREGLLLLRRVAAMMGRERAEVFLPKRSRLVRAARRAGYEKAAWGGAAILYERSTGVRQIAAGGNAPPTPLR